MTLAEHLDEALRRATSGEAWHGPALVELLEGVSAATASARPLAGAHTIWELVLHLTAWTREVTRRLEGADPAEPREGDWPTPGTTAPEWQAAVRGLLAANDELRAALRALPAEHLAAMVGSTRDAPLGTGLSVAQTVAGLVQHHAYHGGQIALLRKVAPA